MLNKQRIKALLRRCPWLGIIGVKAVRPFQFSREQKAFWGKSPSPKSAQPSVVYFSHYRCASMMVNQRLSDLLAGQGLRTLNYQGYVHPWPIERREDFQKNRKESERFKRFPLRGHYFGPLRYFVDIPQIEEMKVIVVLRDPRDVLVSRYYSEKYNHVRVDERFIEHCERVEKMSLEEFVLAYKDDVKSHYDFYAENLGKLRNALVINYEEMIADFQGFLRAVDQYLELNLESSFIEEIAAKESFEVKKEDVYSHKRSIQPRNFEGKLPQETIAELNQSFAEILKAFHWKV